MSSARKLACGGLALVICTSSVGCAGSRLRNVLAWSPTSDYKTLEEIQAADQKPQEAEPAAEKSPLGARLAALSPFSTAKDADTETDLADKPRAADSADDAGSGRLDRFLSLAAGRKTVPADPFLELDKPTDRTATLSRQVAKVDAEDQVVQGDVAEDDKDAADADQVPERGRALAARAVSKTSRAGAESPTTSSETDRFFAALTGEPARPAKQSPGPGKNADSDAAVDDLESLLAESSSTADDEFDAIYREMRTRASEAGAIRSAEVDEDPVADWSQEEDEVSGKLLAGGAAADVATEFDRIVARTSSQKQEQPKEKDEFEEVFGALGHATPKSHSVARTEAEAEDVFGVLPSGKATPLVDDSAFEWKQSDRTQPPLPRISAAPRPGNVGPAEEQRPNGAGRTASPSGQVSRTSAGTAQRAVALDDDAPAFGSGFDEQESMSEQVRGNASPAEVGSRPSAGTTQLVSHSVVRTEGLSADPFDSNSASTEITGGSSTQATTAAVSGTVASGRQGILRGFFTLRTLGLLVGSIIVAALLFVPKRSKSVQAE